MNLCEYCWCVRWHFHICVLELLLDDVCLFIQNFWHFDQILLHAVNLILQAYYNRSCFCLYDVWKDPWWCMYAQLIYSRICRQAELQLPIFQSRLHIILISFTAKIHKRRNVKSRNSPKKNQSLFYEFERWFYTADMVDPWHSSGGAWVRNCTKLRPSSRSEQV